MSTGKRTWKESRTEANMKDGREMLRSVRVMGEKEGAGSEEVTEGKGKG